MEIIKPRTLSGFMELLPEKQLKFDRMAEVLRKTYASYGFAPLDTPVIEDAQILLAKGGGETEKQIYRFTKGDSDLSLRFDLTVPLAKYVAQHYGELTFPFRRFQIGKVYRGERAQRGRFREFYQADIDVIGDGALDISNEAEIPSIIYRAFTALGLKRFQIRVNNRKILNGFYAMLGLSQQSGEIMRTVDKLDKIGPDKVAELLVQSGLSPEQAREILSFTSITGTNEEVLTALEGYRGRNEIFDQGLEEAEHGGPVSGGLRRPGGEFRRGPDHRPGPGLLHRHRLRDHPAGSPRDRLRLFRRPVRQSGGVLHGPPASRRGISIGLTRLFYVLGEQGMLNPDLPTAPADVLILPMTEDLSAAISLAILLRETASAPSSTARKEFKQKSPMPTSWASPM